MLKQAGAGKGGKRMDALCQEGSIGKRWGDKAAGPSIGNNDTWQSNSGQARRLLRDRDVHCDAATSISGLKGTCIHTASEICEPTQPAPDPYATPGHGSSTVAIGLTTHIVCRVGIGNCHRVGRCMGPGVQNGNGNAIGREGFGGGEWHVKTTACAQGQRAGRCF
eukprot:GGOE01028469.1.p2 GENE.GGOE01028469.1~~GGOE01028469.1.p2  ORF type:complete len:165 (-),score=1.82 GGOE01028469.1:679-1173(-)